jgi:myo-inositol-hexaphosphate 3-phosphohydrolase
LLSKPTKTTQSEAEAKFKRRQDQARDGMKAAVEYEAAASATREKTARLRALREAKEVADAKAEAEKPAVPVKVTKAKAKKK